MPKSTVMWKWDNFQTYLLCANALPSDGVDYDIYWSLELPWFLAKIVSVSGEVVSLPEFLQFHG